MLIALVAGADAGTSPGYAQTVQWSGPSTSWLDPTNWVGGAAPGPGETALFTGAPSTDIVIAGATVSIGAIQFNAGSPAYTFHIDAAGPPYPVILQLTGAGVINNAATQPIFSINSAAMEIVGGTAGNAVVNNNTGSLTFDNATAGSATIGAFNQTLFTNAATAGNATINASSIVSVTSFANAANAGNATITVDNSAQMEFHSGAHAGTASITVDNGSVVRFYDATDARNAQIAVSGNGLVHFRDSSNAGNATITANATGLVQFQDTASAQNATVVVNNNANVVFGGQSTGGDARFIVNAGGTLDLVGLNGAFAGFTAGSFEGAGTFCICGHLATVGGNNLSTEISGRITGLNGALTKAGTGTLILSGTADYTGATTVDGGTLRVNTDLTSSSSVTVNAGGTLGGNGMLPSTTINGGTLAPGNSIGTLTVQGNLVLSSAATYLVELDPASSDRTLVTGTASLAGTVRAVFAPGTYAQRNYTILTANGGRSGTFGALDVTSLPAGFTAALAYDASNAFVTLTAVLGQTQAPLPSAPLNDNQRNVATSLNSYFNSGGVLSPRFVDLFRLSGESLRSALSQVSGEIATQSAQGAFSSVDYFLNLMLDPFVTSRGGDAAPGGAAGANNFAAEDVAASAYAAKRQRSPAEQDAYAAMARKAPLREVAFDRRWSVWGAGYGGELKADGNNGVGSRDASTRAFGFAVGADYRFSPDTLGGFALSGGGTHFSLAEGAGSGRSDVFQAGAFVRHSIGQGYLKAAVDYGWHDVTTERTIALSGIDKLEGRYNASSFGVRGEGGYRFATPWMGVTPYAAAQSITFFQPGYADQVTLGLNTFALNYASRDITSARSELGLRSDKSFVVDAALVTLRGRAAWTHYVDGDRALTANFLTLAAPAFVVTGAGQARDAALVSASADVKWANGISIAGVFEGEFSDRTRGYAGKGVIRYAW